MDAIASDMIVACHGPVQNYGFPLPGSCEATFSVVTQAMLILPTNDRLQLVIPTLFTCNICPWTDILLASGYALDPNEPKPNAVSSNSDAYRAIDLPRDISISRDLVTKQIGVRTCVMSAISPSVSTKSLLWHGEPRALAFFHPPLAFAKQSFELYAGDGQ